jgi:hypothetical protein
MQINSLRTTKSILRRYLQINQDFKEEYVNYLLGKEDYDEAAVYLKKVDKIKPQIDYFFTFLFILDS